jgi:hypothetical protein
LLTENAGGVTIVEAAWKKLHTAGIKLIKDRKQILKK